MQLLQNCIGPTIRIGREILCLPYAGFFSDLFFSSNFLDSVSLQYYEFEYNLNLKPTKFHRNCSVLDGKG